METLQKIKDFCQDEINEFSVLGYEPSKYQLGYNSAINDIKDIYEEIPDNSHQLEKLEAEKKELLSILKGLVSDVGNLIGEHDIEWQQAGYFESAKEVIQKHKQ